MRPFFVVFEGLDGSGTSTQAARLELAWRTQGRQCCITSEPSTGPIGQMIRQAFKGRLHFARSADLFDRQMAYLFAADRFDHLYNDVDGVLTLLKRGISVIGTRYIPSSFAYHCKSDIDWQRVSELNKEFPDPDLLVYLRNPVEESVRRMRVRPTLDSYENEEKLAIAALNYDRYFREYRKPSLMLDATLSQDAIHEGVLQALAHLD